MVHVCVEQLVRQILMANRLLKDRRVQLWKTFNSPAFHYEKMIKLTSNRHMWSVNSWLWTPLLSIIRGSISSKWSNAWQQWNALPIEHEGGKWFMNIWIQSDLRSGSVLLFKAKQYYKIRRESRGQIRHCTTKNYCSTLEKGKVWKCPPIQIRNTRQWLHNNTSIVSSYYWFQSDIVWIWQ